MQAHSSEAPAVASAFRVHAPMNEAEVSASEAAEVSMYSNVFQSRLVRESRSQDD